MKRLFEALFGTESDERRIGLLASGILAFTALVTGAVVFYVVEQQLKQEMEKGIARTLADRERIFSSELEHRAEDAHDAAALPHLAYLLRQVEKTGVDDNLRLELQGVLITQRLAGVALLDSRGEPLLSLGRFVAKPEVEVALQAPAGAALLWQDGYYLDIDAPIREGGRLLGTLRMEMPLKTVTDMATDFGDLGESGEVAVCAALDPESMQCFPTRHRPQGFTSPRKRDNRPLPLSLAADGQSGFLVVSDYRGEEVFDAYKPVGYSGLGMVVKMDTAELKRAIRRHLAAGAGVIVLFIIAGVGLLRWRVGPIVKEMVESRSQLKQAHDELSGSFAKLSLANQELEAAQAESQRATQDALQARAQEQAILDHAAEGIITVNQAGSIGMFNQAASRIFGHAAAEVLGKNAGMLMPEAYRAEHDNHLAHYVRAGEKEKIKTNGMEVLGVAKSGAAIPLRLLASEVNINGERNTILLVEDISERKQAEQALRQTLRDLMETNEKLEQAQNQLLQSEKMASVGQLAAGVAHEINNPIGYVYSNLGALEKYLGEIFGLVRTYEEAEAAIADPAVATKVRQEKKKADLEFLKEDMGSLMNESKEGITRVKKIVQDLKDFSHVDASNEWQIADLHKGLDTTLNIVHNDLKYKAQVVKEYGDVPEVECLISQINQVFMNMLVNAGHAIEEKGTITLRSGRQGDEVWVSISDTGKGIAPENLQRIFDPFFTTKPVGKGTGLGLSLSYGIVQKHHGRIEVESEVGIGTTFKIILPIKQPEQMAVS